LRFPGWSVPSPNSLRRGLTPLLFHRKSLIVAGICDGGSVDSGAAEDIDILSEVMERHLRQADVERILKVLTSTEQHLLLQRITDLLRRLSALFEISTRISESLSLDVVLPRLMGIITDAMNADRSSLFLYDPETDTLFSRVAQGDTVGEIRFPANAGIAGLVFQSGEGLMIADAYADPRFNQEVDRRTGYRTHNILCSPLRNKRNELIGVAQVLNKQSGDFSDDDLSLLQILTTQAAAALENAQLFEKVERARHEEMQLLDVTSAISSELQLDPLLNKIITVTSEMLGADRSSLFIYDAKADQLWSRVAQGAEIKEIRFPASAGIAGACFRSGQPLHIPDAYADDRFNQEVDRKTGYRTRNILCMPLFNKRGECVGVMQVLNKHAGQFHVTDERRLRAFTAQAAIALENARLFDDVLNVKNYNESILKSLSNGVITLDAERRIEKVNEAARQTLRLDDGCLHLTLDEVFGPDNAWLEASVAKVAASGRSDMALDTDIRLGGEAIAVNMNTVPLIDIAENNIGFMLVFEDISREKRVKTTMARYMTKEIMDKLLEEGEDLLGGAAQEVTILFSDIRSFTTISEAIGARETVSMLNGYFTEMVEVIFAHGGILDKYIGDAIMALFGAPLPGPEDADNAIAVANDMMRVLRRLNILRASRGEAAIDIGVGLSTGEVVAGNIGSPKRMDYTVIGDSVNLASRLEGANKAYGTHVLLSGYTHERLKKPALTREIDLIRVKGKVQPVAVYEALDHFDDASFPHLHRVVELFGQGVAAYRRRDWAAAVGRFAAALEANPADLPSRIYLDRCRHYADQPPAEGWDGVWTMSEK
jgi:adenylate cyclase